MPRATVARASTSDKTLTGEGHQVGTPACWPSALAQAKLTACCAPLPQEHAHVDRQRWVGRSRAGKLVPVHEGRAESVRSLVARWLMAVVMRASVPNGSCSVLVLHVHVWLNAAACASSVILWWVPCAGESAWAPLDRVISCCSEASESRVAWQGSAVSNERDRTRYILL